jgi:hypothetical protein
VSVSQRANALLQSVHDAAPGCHAILFLAICLYPGPQLHASASFSCPIPRPLSPALGIPSPNTKPQVELLRVCMLQDLPKRPRKVAKVLLLERLLRLVAEKVERGKQGTLGERPEKQSLVVASGRSHAGHEGGEQQEKE